MLNQEWYSSLGCLAFSDLVYICVMVLFVARYHPDEPSSSGSSYFSIQPQKSDLAKETILLINVGIFVYLNLTYLLTQFMNPGVINLHTIPDEYYEKNGGKIFCSSCNGYRSKNKIAHCKHCDVCVWGLDHHCGFFNKCIAGYQAWAFYGLMLGAFAAFVGALITISLGLLWCLYFVFWNEYLVQDAIMGWLHRFEEVWLMEDF